MNIPLTTFSLCFGLTIVSNLSAANAARFYELGSGLNYSEPTAISANGRVVVGYAEDNDGIGHPFRQVRLGRLEALPVNTSFFGIGVSADGSVMVANSESPVGYHHAFLWSKKTGISYIETEPGFTVEAVDISGDGKVVCGYLYDLNSSTIQPIRWSAKTGFQLLADSIVLSGDPSAANYNGDVIVGGVWSRPAGHQACRWLREESVELLPDHGMLSYAQAVNSDGRVAVGYSRDLNNNFRAVRWTADSGMQLLDGNLAVLRSLAMGVSADGSRVAGELLTTSGEQNAFLWTSTSGLQIMDNQFRAALPRGWRFVTATAISGDGRWIVGTAESPRKGLRSYLLDTGFKHSGSDK